MFSYSEINQRLREYKQSLHNEENCKLYFSKVDIKSCFETINHDKLIEMIKTEILTEVCIY